MAYFQPVDNFTRQNIIIFLTKAKILRVLLLNLMKLMEQLGQRSKLIIEVYKDDYETAQKQLKEWETKIVQTSYNENGFDITVEKPKRNIVTKIKQSEWANDVYRAY